MKNCFFICFLLLLLLGCGSPLDEGYWKDYNREADLSGDDGEERSFNIDFETLHQNIDMTFSAETFRRKADQKLAISVTVNHPTGVTITEFRLRNDACPAANTTHNIPNADTETIFSRNGVDLATVSDDVNRNLEDQFIYLRGTVTSGTGIIDLACSQITL